jgi:hypothetical protein
LRGPSYTLLPLSRRQQLVSLSQSSCVSPVTITDGRVGEGGGGDVEKAWPSVNHSILSAATAPDFISFPFFISSSFSSPGLDFANFDLIQIIQIIHPFLD